MSFEKTWQPLMNYVLDSSNTANTGRNAMWFIMAFLTGKTGGVKTLQGMWTVDSSCDSVTAGSAGDHVDRWSALGSTTGGSGSAATFTTGATIPGAIRLTGVTGMTSGHVGNHVSISGAASGANNGAFKIVAFNSSTSVDIYNPFGVVADANNGAIAWQERGDWTFDASKIVAASPGTAHSWVVMRSPAALGPLYLLLDVANATNQLTYVVSKTQPSGGTTTNRPVAPDELTGSPWANQPIYSASGTAKSHGALATDGNWHTMLSQDGNGSQVVFSFQTMQALADAHAPDTAPCLAYFNQNSGSSPVTRGNLQGGNAAMRTVDNTFNIGPTASGAANMQPMFWLADDGTDWLNAMTTDFTDSAYDDMPVYWTVAFGPRSIRGRWTDYYWCSSNLASNQFEPASGAIQSISQGHLWLPADAAIVF